MIETITLAAKSVGIVPALLLALCFQESSFQHFVVINDGGSASMGVCQLKYTTAQRIEPNVRPSDLFKPEVNARIAAKYLQKQIARYKGQVWCGVESYNKGHAQACSGAKYVKRVRSHIESQPWVVAKNKD